MQIDRRSLIQSGAAGLVGTALPGLAYAAIGEGMRRIPSTGEAIPAIGMGTWITFNVGNDPGLRENCADVLDAFIEAGGGMLDSSPMYGSAQTVIGHALQRRGSAKGLFAADKVWTGSGAEGSSQIERSRGLWNVPNFDLMQVHNLLGVEAHLETLFAMKAAGHLRYVGITTSHGRRHADFETIMRRHPLDFVQLTYNAVDREAERRLLPLAEERGIGVIVNRPFQRGGLIARTQGAALPGWASEIGATSWAQLMLKFIISHSAVTVAIPATSQIAHIRENKAAALGPMPDPAIRARIAAAVDAL